MYVLPLLFALASSQKVRPDIAAHPNWGLLDRGEDCGQSSSDRIIGGHNAWLGQYPWIALLGYAFEPDTKNVTVEVYNCGGTIVNERYILTAAHCHPKSMPGVDTEMAIDLVQVRLGENNMLTNPDCQDGVCAPRIQDIDVERVVCHKDFNNLQQHDICLVRLVKPIQFNKYVHPVCLPAYEKFTKMDFSHTVFEVAGWGIVDVDSGNRSNILQTLNIPFTNPRICLLSYQSKGNQPLPDAKNQLCAGGVVGQDSCTGDSGGPLVTSLSVDGPPRYFLVGVVSYGPSSCGFNASPGVYTNVTAYMGWILDNIAK